ncbi:MAG: hypothetical protein JXR76_12205 [Deltaproteobacteria bacterium]|nr:hypothetical protein [Deltaproteobacteria bacterium]
MIRKPGITFICICIFGMIASPLWAQTVAVLPTVYEDADSGDVDNVASTEFHEALLDGIKDAGFETLSGGTVTDAVTAHSVNGECNHACLEAVRETLGGDDTLKARVAEDRKMETRHLSIVFAKREKVDKYYVEGYAVVMSELKREVGLQLKQNVQTQPVVDDESLEPAPEPVTISPEPVGKEGKTTVEVINDNRRRLGLLPIIISGSITVALGATTLIVDGIAHRNYTNLKNNVTNGSIESESEFDSDFDTIKTQKLMAKIFLGATAVGLVTTGVLAFFTDFSKHKREKLVVQPSFAVGQNFGAVAVLGSF